MTFKVASAKVKFQGKPAVRSENRSRLLWVETLNSRRRRPVVVTITKWKSCRRTLRRPHRPRRLLGALRQQGKRYSRSPRQVRPRALGAWVRARILQTAWQGRVQEYCAVARPAVQWTGIDVCR